MTAIDDGAAQLFLTFAELEYLLGAEPGWTATREAWGLPRPNDPDETAAAGLASLAVRSLVTTTADDAVLDDAVAGARGLIMSATWWVRVVQTKPDEIVFAVTLVGLCLQ